MDDRRGILAAEDADIAALCRENDLVVSTVRTEAQGPCLLIDPAILRRTGTVAVDRNDTGFRIIPTEARRRVWSAAPREGQ